MSRLRKCTLVALAIAVVTLAGAAIAFATGAGFTGSDGVIRACANTNNGNLRALDSESSKPGLQTCKRE